MRVISDEIQAGIGALEAAAHFQGMVKDLQAWPGLSGGQRMVALVIAALEFKEGRAPGSLDVARWSGLSQERVEKVFEGLENAPYYWSEDPATRSWVFLPSQALEYGEA